MKLNRIIGSVILLAFVLTNFMVPTTIVNAAISQNGYYYKVVKGDTLVKISLRSKVSVSTLIKVNNLTRNLRVGQRIFIPKTITKSSISLKPPYVGYLVKTGDTLSSIANEFGTTTKGIIAYNPRVNWSNLRSGQKLYLPVAKDYVIYRNYTIKSGDNLWDISLKYGLPMDELLRANSMNRSSVPKLGQVIKIPIHFTAVRATKSPRSGQQMDWFTAAQYVFSIGTKAKVKDIKTGKTFMIKRTYGAFHADVEALTARDTAIMKSIWGGHWSWSKRPILVFVGSYRIAASAAGMPHAGLDRFPADKNVANRSDNYGYGPNLDQIKNNNMNGHFDIHFLNSRRHVDNQVDAKHQADILKASNVK